MKKLMTAGMALAMVLAGYVQTASASVWVGGTSADYFDGSNWSPAVTDFKAGDFDILTDGGQPVPVISAASSTVTGARGFWIGKYHSGAVGYGQLDVTGGTHIMDGNGPARVGLGNGGTGVYNQTGGSMTLHSLQVGLDAGSTGTLNLMDGTLILGKAQASDTWSASIGANGNGTVNISGGTFLTRSGVNLGAGGDGTFRIIGSDAIQIGIGSQSSINGNWDQTATGVLAAQVDAGGITPIFIEGTQTGANAGDVTFAAGSLLDLSFEGAAVAGTWTLMQWEGALTDNGLALAPGVDAGIWSFNLDETNKELTITAIPEPATLGLIGLFGVGLLTVRRFRM